jgi:molybdenum cofactor biosynthesis enzyme MoaA
MSDAYAPNKLAAHPEVLADLRAGGPGRLISVHLMPMNTCNQRCTFCSYRMPENKNAEDFNEGVHLNAMAMLDLLAHFSFIGVQGVEVTGGGEPLAYPHTDALWKALKHHNFATALVTNGTLLKDRAPLICDSRLKWVRVSIDAARESTYALMRKAPPKHFVRAWNAVEEFRKHAPKDPEFRLGVGFVLSNENWTEVYDFVRMARDHGADNVRLSSTFSDKQLAYFGPDVDLKAASAASEQAKADFEDATFKVHNQIPRRLWETEHPAQDYERCTTKDLLCVVEGEGRVYTCCTFTGSKKGLMGNFLQHPRGFRGVWEDNAEWRKSFNAKEYCKVACLYRERNLAMIDLIAAPTMPEPVTMSHQEFV